MKKDEIIKAPIEEVTDTWVEFYNRAQSLSTYVYTYCGDIFDSSDIKDFNESIKKIDEEMELIEQLRPDVIAYLFGDMEDEH